MNANKLSKVLTIVAAAFFPALFAGEAAATPFDFEGGSAVWSDGWVTGGYSGRSKADGDIAPQSGTWYGYVAADAAGNALMQHSITADAGDSLQFYFNYITSDGREFADYAQVRLLDSVSLNPIVTLLTLKTEDGIKLIADSAVTVTGKATLTGGAWEWSLLGNYSGNCWDGAPCGFTGWTQADYTFGTSGTFLLEFSVFNELDNEYHSGLAFDDISIRSPSTPPGSVPEPASLALFGAGLVGLAALRRRK